MRQESFEQTQRRLGLTPTEAEPTTTSTEPVQPRRSSGIGLVVAIVAGVLVFGAVGLAAFQFLPLIGDGTDEWTSYPGTYFEDSDVILAGDSLEVSEVKADQLLAEMTAALDGYGFEWSTLSESAVYPAGNGYKGDSMLQLYVTETVVGSVTLNDPDARAEIIEIFSSVVAAPGVTVVVDNDTILGDDAEWFFGSADRDEQAQWTAWSYGENFAGLDPDIAVFDSAVATGADFETPYWVTQDSTGTIFVRLLVKGRYLLAENDREAFIEALEPYEGKTKPDYRE